MSHRHDAVLRDLAAIGATRPEAALLQFRSLVTARQYVPLYRAFERHVRPGAAVLDWGAGNGHFSHFLLATGYRATGFAIADVSAEWLASPGYRLVLGDPAEPVQLPFEDASFDAVSSVGVLEHVRETGGREEASLAEIARVLRPGGAFVCFHFPNRGSWIDGMARRVPGRHHHRWRYARADIERLAAGAGLALAEAHRYGVLPRNAWHRAPAALRDARVVADVWDLLDRALALPFAPIAQNWLWVGRKTDLSGRRATR